MFDTERNQPMRVCAGTGTDSTRKLGMSNGMLIADMPSSNGCWPSAPAAKVEPMVGAAVRCSQATALPCASTPASSRSTDTVWK